MTLERLKDHYWYLSTQKDEESMQEFDSLIHFFEVSITYYQKAFDFIKGKLHCTRIFDIGCAFGFQSELLINSSIQYVGINDVSLNFWNKDKYQYIVKSYPFVIQTLPTDIAVSIYCIGWYNNLIEKQIKRLAEDFQQIIINVDKEYFYYLKKYFVVKEILNNDDNQISPLLYCVNKKTTLLI